MCVFILSPCLECVVSDEHPPCLSRSLQCGGKGEMEKEGGGGARVKAVCEMPRPCVGIVLQAKEETPVYKKWLNIDAFNERNYHVNDNRTVTTQDQSQ